MRLGKRERAALRLRREQAAILAEHDSRRQGLLPAGNYASAWRRFFPALRPVNADNGRRKPHNPAWAQGSTHGKRMNKCPDGIKMLPTEETIRPARLTTKRLPARWSNPRLA